MGGDKVYRGFWRNYSSNKGLPDYTLTLTEKEGTAVLALLALLIGTAGQSFWMIISYVIHQSRCQKLPRHPIFYQQQAVLRNSGSALTAALRFMQLSLNWRPSSRKAKNESQTSHTLFYITTALTISVGFAIIGTFASQLITKSASAQVLLRPHECGYFELRNYSNPDNAKVYLSADADAQMYAGRCYEMNSTLACRTNMKRYIRFTPTDAACPFNNPEACVGSSKPAYRLDTRYMDSNLMFGLNARPTQRLQVRKVATCAPLNLANYLLHEPRDIDLGNGNVNNVRIGFFQLGPRCRTQGLVGIGNETMGGSTTMNMSASNNMGTHAPPNTTYQYVKAAQQASLGYDLRYV